VLSADHVAEGVLLALDLGDVREVAEVFVNDRPVGVNWMAPRRLDITSAATPGENRLSVVVTNLLINKVLGDPDPDYSALIRRYGPIRFPFPGEKQSGLEPLPSGLLGPVRIVPRLLVELSREAE
jgi:hypothetical protein